MPAVGRFPVREEQTGPLVGLREVDHRVGLARLALLVFGALALRARVGPRQGDGPDDPFHPVNRVLGDVLVTTPSAAGLVPDTAVNLLPGATVRRCPTITHVALANRAELYDLLHQWWDG